MTVNHFLMRIEMSLKDGYKCIISRILIWNRAQRTGAVIQCRTVVTDVPGSILSWFVVRCDL